MGKARHETIVQELLKQVDVPISVDQLLADYFFIAATLASRVNWAARSAE